MPEPNPSKKERREAARAARVEAERKQAAADARKKRLGMLGGVLALAAVVVVAAILISSSGSDTVDTEQVASGQVTGVDDTNAMFDGVPQNGMVLGQADAPSTLHQAEDPQCPACKQYSETILPQVIQNDVRTNKAKIQLSMYPFIGPDSDRGAQFVVAAARQNRAFYALELIYRNQGGENEGYMTDEYLRQIAQAAGLNVDQVMRDMTSTAVRNEVQRQESFATTNSATGTPTLWTQRGDGDLTKFENFTDVAGISQALAAS